MKYSISEEIITIFRKKSNYGSHFIIKKLAEELEGQCTCLGEKPEKYKIFPVSEEMQIKRNDKNVEKVRKIHCLDNIY